MRKPSIKLITTTCMLASLSFLTACNSMEGNKNFTNGEYDYTHHEYGKAFPELLAAAQGGNARAQYAIGYMYYHGIGVGRNSQLAYGWMARSAKQGYQPAINALSILQSGSHAVMIHPSNAGGSTGRGPGEGGTGESRHAAPPPPKRVVYENANAQHQEAYDEAARKGEGPTPMEDGFKSSSKSVYETDESKIIATEHNQSKPQEAGTTSNAPATNVTTTTSTEGTGTSSTSTSAPEQRQSANVRQTQYAVQLYGDYDRTAAVKFIRDRGIESFAKVYETKNNGRNWYVVLDGEYPSFAHARNAMNQLSSNLLALHPWVRPVRDAS